MSSGSKYAILIYMNNAPTILTTRGQQDIQAMLDFADYRAAKRAAAERAAASTPKS